MATITLREWMAEKGYSNRTLADRMDLSYDYIYQLTTETVHNRPIGLAFQMRFIKCFGMDEAGRVFGEISGTENA